MWFWDGWSGGAEPWILRADWSYRRISDCTDSGWCPYCLWCLRTDCSRKNKIDCNFTLSSEFLVTIPVIFNASVIWQMGTSYVPGPGDTAGTKPVPSLTKFTEGEDTNDRYCRETFNQGRLLWQGGICADTEMRWKEGITGGGRAKYKALRWKRVCGTARWPLWLVADEQGEESESEVRKARSREAASRRALKADASQNFTHHLNHRRILCMYVLPDT